MPSKAIFITVGATASFDALIQAVLQSTFLHTLARMGYSELFIQYGQGGKELFNRLLEEAQEHGPYGIAVEAFEFTQNMMQSMRVAKAERGREEGVVLCHAGTGSVLDAIRIGVPVIVVPNPTLLDNHQVEFAEVMADMGYVVHGHLNNLEQALQDSEALRKKNKEWPPVNSGIHRKAKGLEGVIDEEMGYLD
ncbi:family 28 putative glycosyltransferase [Tothia fuscella]|uniref:UDP-N-acetylglucosamine transferase subunit ALG13 n=1 Tax=Tothia fuscella TaxID=1048955 RepID=A0A9P4TV10_9PEZI|nr:family 28 putative glycosyltransferase [Tothia fuscella]